MFELTAKFVTKFGSEGSETGEIMNPISTVTLSDGRIYVSDFNNNQIQVFDQIGYVLTCVAIKMKYPIIDLEILYFERK